MILDNAVLKGIGFFAAFILIAEMAFAQPANGKAVKPEDKKEVKEVPAASNHGKSIREQAREIPGGPEKGKIISSAARQSGIENREIKEVGAGQSNSSRVDHVGKPEAKGQKPAETGKLTQPPLRPKPVGLSGG